MFGLSVAHTTDNPLAALNAPLRVANALHVAWIMLRLHAWPWPLSIEYSYNVIPMIREWMPLAGWILASLILLAAWIWASRRNPVVCLAGGIYLAAFATTANILFPVGSILGERWAYLPSVGFCLLAGAAYEWLEARRPRIAVIVFSGMIVAAALLTVIRNRDWKDNFTLVSAAARTYPESVKVQCSLGLEYLRMGNLPSAETHLNAAARIQADYPTVEGALGSLAYRKGDWETAERHLQIAMRESAGYPFEVDAVLSYAALLVQGGQLERAKPLLNQTIVAWPGNTRAYSIRALLYYLLRKPDLARADAETALRLNPANTQAMAVLERLRSL
jgi:tetratricopeptide (TPR) repeat protein